MDNKKQPSIINWYTRIGVLLLYACFFFAQMNFNYDCASLMRAQFIESALKTQAKNTDLPVIKINKSGDKKFNLHLNKRFQPESFDLNEIATIQAPVAFILPKTSSLYTNPFTSAYNAAANSLRGPPNSYEL